MSDFPSRERLQDAVREARNGVGLPWYLTECVRAAALYAAGRLLTPEEAATSDHDVLRVRWPDRSVKAEIAPIEEFLDNSGEPRTYRGRQCNVERPVAVPPPVTMEMRRAILDPPLKPFGDLEPPPDFEAMRRGAEIMEPAALLDVIDIVERLYRERKP